MIAGGAGGLVRASEMEGGEGSAVSEWVWSKTKFNQFAFSQSKVMSSAQATSEGVPNYMQFWMSWRMRLGL